MKSITCHNFWKDGVLYKLSVTQYFRMFGIKMIPIKIMRPKNF